jgi:hypothetical protein
MKRVPLALGLLLAAACRAPVPEGRPEVKPEIRYYEIADT